MYTSVQSSQSLPFQFFEFASFFEIHDNEERFANSFNTNATIISAASNYVDITEPEGMHYM